MLACQAGARRAYAIEASESLEFARVLAARERLSQSHRVHPHNRSTSLVLPERVNAIVGGVHDTFGLQPSGLTAMMDARDRFLAPGGVLIPCSIRLMAAPVEAPEHYQRDDRRLEHSAFTAWMSHRWRPGRQSAHTGAHGPIATAV